MMDGERRKLGLEKWKGLVEDGESRTKRVKGTTKKRRLDDATVSADMHIMIEDTLLTKSHSLPAGRHRRHL